MRLASRAVNRQLMLVPAAFRSDTQALTAFSKLSSSALRPRRQARVCRGPGGSPGAEAGRGSARTHRPNVASSPGHRGLGGLRWESVRREGDGLGRSRLRALIVVLGYSRHSFVWPTFSQKLEDVIAGLKAAWAFFGGIRRYLVFNDNKECADQVRVQCSAVRGRLAGREPMRRFDNSGPVPISFVLDFP